MASTASPKLCSRATVHPGAPAVSDPPSVSVMLVAVDQADAQPRLLEAGPTLPRRDRVHDHPQRLHSDPGPRRPQVRSYGTGLRADIAAERDQEPSAGDKLRGRE